MRQSGQTVVFEVDEAWRLPDFGSGPVADVGVVSDHGSTSYFDTASGRLRGLGLTLQQRQDDEGVRWLLDLPGGGAQAGLQNGDHPTPIPATLVRQLEGVLAGESLVEVASVSTTRDTHRLWSQQGQLIAEVVDAHRRGVTLGDASTVAQWRQIELRPGPDDAVAEAREIRKLLKRSGAARGDEATDLDRLYGQPHRVSPEHRLVRRVGDYVSHQCAELLLSDVALRDHSDARSVHRMRVAIRRLRSVIKAFPGLLPDEAVAAAEDFGWVAGQLGAVRDLDVLDARVTEAVRALPEADLVGPVSRHLAETLHVRRAQAWESWQHAWADDRYARVMAAAARWHAEPPVQPESTVSAKKVLTRTTARLNRRLKAATTHPERWHDARKAAKRLRYVAEVLEPLTSSAAASAKRAKRLQTRLGEHQDATVAAQLLAEQGRAAGARDDDNGFSYGLLLAEQRRLAARSLRSLPARI